MFELLLQLVIEIIAQVIFELLAAMGLESLADSGIRERESRPLAAATTQFVMGLCAGVLSVLIYSRRLTPHSAMPGLSLVLSPLGTGMAMHWLGEMWRDRGKAPPALFSFKAGALFAFGMAVVRFVSLELGWNPFQYMRLVPARSAAGFTVKSGWASAVLVTETDGLPEVEDSRRVELSDPGIPASRQPYHAGFGTARDGGPELARSIASIEQFGTRSVARLIEQWQIAEHQLGGAGLVVGSLVDPDTLANPHIRIHALEGRLFRRVVEHGAKQRGVSSSVWRVRDLYAGATEILGGSEQEIRDVLRAFGRTVAGSWRAEEKAATLAAWLVLAGGSWRRPARRRAVAKSPQANQT